MSNRRPLGLKLIIGYKLLKAPFMVVVALWLSIAPDNAFHLLDVLAHELTEGGELWIRIGTWLESHLSRSLITRGALLAWFEAMTSALEGVLLLLGRTWGEWIVVLGLATLLPFEMSTLIRRPSLTKLLVLVANAAIVFYLARRRLVRVPAVRDA